MMALRFTVCASLWLQALATEEGWPGCVSDGQALLSPKPLFTDVRRFIRHPEHIRHRSITFKSEGDIGMALREKVHEKGELVDDVIKGSQAQFAGVQKGWIITAINGRRFVPNEGRLDLSADFATAKKKGLTLVVDFDVRTAVDCPDADCHKSDRFPASSASRCAIACELITECAWWSWDASQKNSPSVCRFLSEASGMAGLKGVSSAKRGCFPKPVFDVTASAGWPSCAASDSALVKGTPLFADVRPFINHPDHVRHKEIIFLSDGNIGMGLREKPHDLGEVVSDVLPDSQARDMGVQRGWIIREVAGRPFKKSENLTDVGADFAEAKREGPTLTVKFDVKSSNDCANGNCSSSDKFPADSHDICAQACAQIVACQSWSFGLEDEDQMCWLRSDVASLTPEVGSIVGSKACRRSSFGRNCTFVFVLALAAFALFRLSESRLSSNNSALGGLCSSLQSLVGYRGKYSKGVSGTELGHVSDELGMQDGNPETHYFMTSGSTAIDDLDNSEELRSDVSQPVWRKMVSSGVETATKSIEHGRAVLGRQEQDFDL
eukprot:TRINITY_DN8271_c0_g1_i1.p1 TRINITY_DN8271_c0_g1~~TRINITY_DN8271_c0_g1_i1.p1  ORF type:complete len:551 (+),score=78.76 TRINITY_DN8271_c0_g1_i1:52-1704(+)